MSQGVFVAALSYLELIFCAVVLLALVRSGAARKFIFLTSLLGIRTGRWFWVLTEQVTAGPTVNQTETRDVSAVPVLG